MIVDRSQNLADMKQKISSFVKLHGPSLPIHLSKETKTSLLLASAFLSDMVSEKSLKISNLKVGGSPVYFLPGQEYRLETFSNYLHGKEKDAFLLLRQSKILRDDEQEPAIRVAIRAIKDFAIPFTVKFQDSSYLFWQYFSLTEEEAQKMISENLEKIQIKAAPTPIVEVSLPAPQKIEEVKVAEEIKKEVEKEIEKEVKLEVEEKVEEKPAEKLEEKKEEIKQEKKIESIFKEDTKPSKKEKAKPDRFLEEIKTTLASRNLELIKVEKSDKKEVLVRVNSNGKEMLVFAFDKKRVSEDEIMKAWKKASNLGLVYTILIRDELSKKTKEAIEAYKNLEKIEKI